MVYPSLFPQICSFENLFLAYCKARKGKRSKESTAAFEYDQEKELLRLRDELVAGAWQPGAYHSFYIHDPKRRLISAAPFRDRVVHHALCNLLEPIWERRFVFDSYANRKGKGTHRAILRCNQFARQYRYVLQCDVEQFFPGIDHQILFGQLARWIDDPLTLSLINKILKSGEGIQAGEYKLHWFDGDGLDAKYRPRGLPIGNLTSQFWANVYLNPFDHFAKRELRCPAYVRYVDDFLLFSNNMHELHGWKIAVQARLSGFRLTLHEPQVYPVKNGIPFLGFCIHPDHRRLKKRRGVAFQRRFRHLYKQWVAGEIPSQRLEDSARSWKAHASWGETHGLQKAVLGGFNTV
jgi:RNA-directed DNA polymerase